MLGGRLLLVALAAASAAITAASAKTPPAYCNIPTAANPAWAFRAGAPIAGPSGSYAHGHGSLAGQSVSGIVCQVDRSRGAPDRQVIVKIYGQAIEHVHGIKYGGLPANILVMQMSVMSSTDSRCAVHTSGTLTLIATFNGIHHDKVKLAFAPACSDHDHVYTGAQVTALIPP